MLNCLIVGIGGFIGTVCRYLIGLLPIETHSGFTTFSTFAYESTDLLKSGHVIIALAYVCTNIVLGVLAVYAAQMLVH